MWFVLVYVYMYVHCVCVCVCVCVCLCVFVWCMYMFVYVYMYVLYSVLFFSFNFRKCFQCMHTAPTLFFCLQGFTPLWIASLRGHLNVVQALLQRKETNINQAAKTVKWYCGIYVFGTVKIFHVCVASLLKGCFTQNGRVNFSIYSSFCFAILLNGQFISEHVRSDF